MSEKAKVSPEATRRGRAVGTDSRSASCFLFDLILWGTKGNSADAQASPTPAHEGFDDFCHFCVSVIVCAAVRERETEPSDGFAETRSPLPARESTVPGPSDRTNRRTFVFYPVPDP